MRSGGRTVNKQGREDPCDGGHCPSILLTVPIAVATRKKQGDSHPKSRLTEPCTKQQVMRAFITYTVGVSPVCPKWLERAREEYWLSFFIVVRGDNGSGQGLT